MAKGVIGNLRVNMGLDSAQFQAGMKQAQGSADRFAKALKTTMVAAAAAVSAAMAAVSVAVKRTIASANNLGDVADRLGVNVERLQELRYAAERGGMGVQNFDVALRRFIRRAAEAAKGTGAAKNAFKELGVALRDTNGRLKPSEVLLHDVADAMQKVPNSADKLRLAFQMFDTDGAAMVNVLANGSDGMKEMAAEAQRLGLVLSEDTVRSAQAITDNFEMAGNVIGGMVNRLTAFLAPAIVVVSEAVVAMALKLHDLIDVLPVVAEYAAVAGGALAIMAAPSIIASVGSLVVAIGTHLVGAVRLLGTVIAANPLGALAVGISVAVTAIYHFRDEIQKAIGVDVVQIVRTAINTVIGVFVGGFDAIAATWRQLPAAMGDLAYQAGYLLADNIRYWINEAILLVDGFIGTLNEKIGTDIGRLSTLAPLTPDNPYKGAAAGVADAAKNAMSAALSRDWIDEIGAAFKGAIPGATDFSSALGGVNDELDDLGGGKGKDSKGKKAKDAIDKIGKAMESAKEALGQGFGSIIEGLVNKTLTWKDAIIQAGQALLKYLNQMNLAQGGGGLFGGGFLQGLVGSLLGFKDGGSFTVGGSGGTDSQLVAFRATPGEMVDVRKGNQARHGGSVAVQVGVSVDDDGKIRAYVMDMGQKAAQAGAQIGVSQVKQQMPGLIANAQARSM